MSFLDDFMPPLPPGFTPDKEFIVDEQSAGTSGEKDPDRDSDYEEFEDKDEVEFFVYYFVNLVFAILKFLYAVDKLQPLLYHYL